MLPRTFRILVTTVGTLTLLTWAVYITVLAIKEPREIEAALRTLLGVASTSVILALVAAWHTRRIDERLAKIEQQMTQTVRAEDARPVDLPRQRRGPGRRQGRGDGNPGDSSNGVVRLPSPAVVDAMRRIARKVNKATDQE